MRKVLALLIVLSGVAGGLVLGVAVGSGSGTGVAARSVAPAGPGAPKAAALDGQQTGLSRSEPGKAVSETGDGADDAAGARPPEGNSGGGPARAYVRLGRPIVIPVVEGGETRALMVFEIALDVPGLLTERAYSAEPRLRDAFLRALLALSHTGAFSETYTDERVVRELRDRLRAVAREILGNEVSDILILDLLRQEM